jgi:high-affinity iron transporter
MIVHMWRTGRRMKGDIEGRLQASAVRPGAAAYTGVFLFTLLMISREGMETALLLMQLHETTYLVLGAALGSVAAGGVAWLWSRFGHRINLALFFQATAIFLFVFVVQLVIKGAHEMSEQQYLPYSELIHSSTESWGPDSVFGHVLTYLLVVLPLAWIAIKSVVSKSPIFPRSSAPVARGSAAR